MLFVDWLTHILNLEESRDEAYSTYLNIVLKQSNLDYFYDATKYGTLTDGIISTNQIRQAENISKFGNEFNGIESQFALRQSSKSSAKSVKMLKDCRSETILQEFDAATHSP